MIWTTFAACTDATPTPPEPACPTGEVSVTARPLGSTPFAEGDPIALVPDSRGGVNVHVGLEVRGTGPEVGFESVLSVLGVPLSQPVPLCVALGTDDPCDGGDFPDLSVRLGGASGDDLCRAGWPPSCASGPSLRALACTLEGAPVELAVTVADLVEPAWSATTVITGVAAPDDSLCAAAD